MSRDTGSGLDFEFKHDGRLWESVRDERADKECHYGGEAEGCTHYLLLWHMHLESGGSMGGNAGASSKDVIDFLAAAANEAESRRKVSAQSRGGGEE